MVDQGIYQGKCRKCATTGDVRYHSCGRPVVSDGAKQMALEHIKTALTSRLNQKGPRAFASTHEILGIITEEFKELTDAVQSNNLQDVMRELTDIAVACVFGLASNNDEALDW